MAAFDTPEQHGTRRFEPGKQKTKYKVDDLTPAELAVVARWRSGLGFSDWCARMGMSKYTVRRIENESRVNAEGLGAAIAHLTDGEAVRIACRRGGISKHEFATELTSWGTSGNIEWESSTNLLVFNMLGWPGPKRLDTLPDAPKTTGQRGPDKSEWPRPLRRERTPGGRIKRGHMEWKER